MNPIQPASTSADEVLVLGRIPPPVTGMTLVTQAVLEQLQSLGPVDFVNWSVGAARRTPWTRLRYIARSFGSILHMLRRGAVDNRRLYLVANSQGGLYLTAALATVAARLGYVIYLHHHVYDYIERRDRRMAWIERRMGPRGVHIVACQGMMRDFCRQYPTRQSFTIIRPSAVSVPIGTARTSRPVPLRLGMLSNLSLAKGLDQAIDTIKTLHDAGKQVHLTLAGPTMDRASSALVEKTVATYPGVVTYLGPTYGEAKAAFFANTDVFLFPTQRESWGIVLHEALAAGIPVITNDRGCTRVVVGERAGLVVRPKDNFVASASEQVSLWLDHPDEYEAASAAAIEQADFLNREGQRTLKEFAAHMFSPPGAVDGLIQSR